jgi:hypothetical protein
MNSLKMKQYARPKAGCARCVWWSLETAHGDGKCHLFRERRWYAYPPCSEYELMSECPDTITLVDHSALVSQ